MNDHGHDHDAGRDRRFRIPTKWVLLGFLAIAAYFLLSEHRAHFIQLLPFLLLLACPLLHMFHGHGGHGGEGPDKDRGRDAGDTHRHEGDTR
jgi:hypothetical protein